MKNIHLVPTTILKKGEILGKCIKELSDVKIGEFCLTHYLLFSKEHLQAYEIYITSDEEIKEEDVVIHLESGIVTQCVNYKAAINNIPNFHNNYKKVILTTDEECTDCGVQTIDYEFLQWFVNNQTCEEVEILKFGDSVNTYVYQIIIPKERELEIKTYNEEDMKEAFSAGESYAVSSHIDFKQIKPAFSDWIKTYKSDASYVLNSAIQASAALYIWNSGVIAEVRKSTWKGSKGDRFDPPKNIR